MFKTCCIIFSLFWCILTCIFFDSARLWKRCKWRLLGMKTIRRRRRKCCIYIFHGLLSSLTEGIKPCCLPCGLISQPGERARSEPLSAASVSKTRTSSVCIPGELNQDSLTSRDVYWYELNEHNLPPSESFYLSCGGTLTERQEVVDRWMHGSNKLNHNK